MSWRRSLYTFLISAIVPLALLRLLWRSRKNAAFRQGFLERLGWVKRESQVPHLWLHAVSVGETIAISPLIKALQQDYPEHRLLISSTTITGAATVKRLFGDRVSACYFPYDVPIFIQRFLNTIQPEFIILMETEIWPNLLATSYQRQIPIILANARLSKRSTQRYLRFKPFIQETLSYFSGIATRSDSDAQRFKQLGADWQQIQVVGNLKFDLALSEKQIQEGLNFRKQWGENRLVWVAASTHEGEDEPLLAIHNHLIKQFKHLLLILVPRHPERFEQVFGLCQQMSAKVQRRSDQQHFNNNTEIILGDSMGEMLSWYSSADLVFMGGSFVNTGGHNPLEPAALAKPVLSGSFVFNFEDVFSQMEAVNATSICHNKEQLEQVLYDLFKDKNKRLKMGLSGHTFMEQNKGAKQRLLALIATQLKTPHFSGNPFLGFKK